MDEGEVFFLLLFDFDDGEVLGCCSYINIVCGVFQVCYLGFFLVVVVQGCGLMVCVLWVVNWYCFEQFGLYWIMVSYLLCNVCSECLLESFGFEREGYVCVYLKIVGVWEDYVLWVLVDVLC